jgi:hypothetical protein
MRESRFGEEQIIAILQEQEPGGRAEEVCRRHGVSDDPPRPQARDRNASTVGVASGAQSALVTRLRLGLPGPPGAFGSWWWSTTSPASAWQRLPTRRSRALGWLATWTGWSPDAAPRRPSSATMVRNSFPLLC